MAKLKYNQCKFLGCWVLFLLKQGTYYKLLYDEESKPTQLLADSLSLFHIIHRKIVECHVKGVTVIPVLFPLQGATALRASRGSACLLWLQFSLCKDKEIDGISAAAVCAQSLE